MTAPARSLLDNRSAPCAVGLIRAAEQMAGLPPGSTLEIWSRDHFAPIEIPLWAAHDGYDVVLHTRGGRWPRRFHVFLVLRPLQGNEPDEPGPTDTGT
jgi:tRNA 2-thiouridine synthesizing protein A